MTFVKIYEYALTLEVFVVDDVVSSDSLELENEVHDQIKEKESTN